jgi:hypothetical protein
MTSCKCLRCSAVVSVRRPGVLARTRLVLAWGFVAAMIAGAGLTGPFLVMVAPFLFVIGSAFISTAHAALEDPLCPRCGASLPAETVLRHATEEKKSSPERALAA